MNFKTGAVLLLLAACVAPAIMARDPANDVGESAGEMLASHARAETDELLAQLNTEALMDTEEDMGESAEDEDAVQDDVLNRAADQAVAIIGEASVQDIGEEAAADSREAAKMLSQDDEEATVASNGSPQLD